VLALKLGTAKVSSILSINAIVLGGYY
jgi:hypothetical protein